MEAVLARLPNAPPPDQAIKTEFLHEVTTPLGALHIYTYCVLLKNIPCAALCAQGSLRLVWALCGTLCRALCRWPCVVLCGGLV